MYYRHKLSCQLIDCMIQYMYMENIYYHTLIIYSSNRDPIYYIVSIAHCTLMELESIQPNNPRCRHTHMQLITDVPVHYVAQGTVLLRPSQCIRCSIN